MTKIIDFEQQKVKLKYEIQFFNPRNDIAFRKMFQPTVLILNFLSSTLRLTDDRQISMITEFRKSILDILCPGASVISLQYKIS